MILYSLKVEVLEVEMDFHNSGRFDPSAQYILLSGRVVAGAKTIQVVKETNTAYIITAASATDFSAFLGPDTRSTGPEGTSSSQ